MIDLSAAPATTPDSESRVRWTRKVLRSDRRATSSRISMRLFLAKRAAVEVPNHALPRPEALGGRTLGVAAPSGGPIESATEHGLPMKDLANSDFCASKGQQGEHETQQTPASGDTNSRKG